MNEFDRQFKIFTQVDTTKSYIILSESIVLMGYEFYETNFNDQTVKLVCICFEIAYTKNHKKQTFRDQVMRQNFSTVIKQKITI